MHALRFASWSIVLCATLHLGTGYALLAQTPVPESKARGPVRISGGVMAGQILTKVNPVYPKDAALQGIGGVVVMKALISKSGDVKSLEVISGPDALRDAALDAVRQWVYRPYILNGEPVDVSTTISVAFSLMPPPSRGTT